MVFHFSQLKLLKIHVYSWNRLEALPMSMKNVIFRPDFFLLIDLREFFSDLGSGGPKKKYKSSENDQLTGHFQSFCFSELFFSFFFNISRKTVKLVR